MGVTRRAKIVCTIGPATATLERLRALLDAGMNVARLNFSHGSRADHEQVYGLVRQAAEATGRPVGVLADLQGPKIRLGRFAEKEVEWRTGDSVVIGRHHQRTHHRQQGPRLLHVRQAAGGGEARRPAADR
jgi:pyruvate kinase